MKIPIPMFHYTELQLFSMWYRYFLFESWIMELEQPIRDKIYPDYDW